MNTTSRVPGKIILSGEHSVLHNCPALTAAVDKYATTQVHVLEENHPSICIEIRPNQAKRSWSMVDAKLIYADLRQNKNHCSPYHFIIYAVLHYLTHRKITNDISINICINSELPIKSGWGASAAILIGLFKSLAKSLRVKPLSLEDLITLATECEHIQHGKSSGIDIATCALGGMVLFDNNRTTPLSSHLTELHVIHTGISHSSTRDCVNQSTVVLANNYKLKNAFKDVTTRMARAITEANFSTSLPDLIKRNHRLLCQLGTVSKDTQHLIDALEKQSIAAKVCGAGSINPGPSGIVWAFGHPDNINTAAQKFGFTTETVQLRHLR